jgi:hypothetical protein
MNRNFAWLGAVLLVGAVLGTPPVRAQDSAPPADTGSRSGWWHWWSDSVFDMGGVSVGGGANRVVGSDKLVHELRIVSGVRSIEIDGPMNLVIKQGQTEKVTVHTDDNVAPLIETKVTDGVLHIGVKPGAGFRTKHPVGVTAEVVQLGALRVSGSGDVVCSQLDTDLLEITLRGSADVRVDALHASTLAVLVQGSGGVHLSGSVPQQGFVIEGSGDIDAAELAGRKLAVRVAGSGDAKVWASEKLEVQIAGSGDVRYRGNPELSKSIAGSGSVSRE